MNTARYSMASSKQDNVAAVMIHADSKRDAQEAIKVAKAWIRSSGRPCKLVYFNEIHGSEYSNLGVRFTARIAYRVA